ncbi:ferredoxin [Georgenia thermotolerans]|uniref:Ferredoxin n=1 Tax=Georgenia thermotolerans TaxID=527326 RepID=A0A7J5UTX7_9MICO|nr:ferredoxin [Georgenia thermotolerans]KAE8765733.1 ferredoxin [Georgenia thermotolerans]
MSDLKHAEQVAVHLDTSRCRAYGICVGILPDVFDLPKGSPVAVLRLAVADGEDLEDLEEAVFNCPAQAISLSRPEETR